SGLAHASHASAVTASIRGTTLTMVCSASPSVLLLPRNPSPAARARALASTSPVHAKHGSAMTEEVKNLCLRRTSPLPDGERSEAIADRFRARGRCAALIGSTSQRAPALRATHRD